MECYCYLRNIQDLLCDGKTPYERGGSEGPMVECHPSAVKGMSRLHQCGPKVLPGIFLGNVLYAVRIWKRDIMVADI